MRKQRRSALFAAVACAGLSGPAFGSAFALMEQNASGLGNAYAGAAAAAEDASTVYYNAAGLSFLRRGRHFAAGIDAIRPSAKFSNSASMPSGTGIPIPAAARPLGGDGGDAGDWTPVPHGYFATDLGERWSFGVGVSAPFGLRTEYDPGWMGRFQAIKSDVKTLNINPTLAYRASNALSVGFGVNYQSIEAELTKAVNYVAAVAASNPAAAATIPAANAEGRVSVKGDDYSWGYNIGVMYSPGKGTRVGVAYRSSIKYRVGGTVSFDNAPPGPVGAGFANGNVALDIELPDMLSVALVRRLDSRWSLLADATWTGWSKIRELKVVRESGAALDTTPENFRDTWRFALGANYRYSDRWTLKAGVAYDQTPVNDRDRTPRLPDEDRTWVSIGGQYRLSNSGTLDIGYAHLFVRDASIDQNAGSTAAFGRLTGTYKNAVDILGVQLSYQF